MRPIIGVAGMYSAPGTLVQAETPLYGSIGLNVLLRDMTDAVEAAGGIAVGLVPTGAPEEIPALLARLDGLLLQGGGDIDPSLYGEERDEKCGPSVPEQDRFELALVSEALRRKLPLLGICRGAQVIHVASGGTLFQDLAEAGLPEHRLAGTDVYALPGHPVLCTPEGGLRSVFGTEKLHVNSLHHQAVKSVGPRTRIEARAEDGVIEAIHVTGAHPFTYGVQWHPELMLGTEVQTKLFAAFVNACRNR